MSIRICICYLSHPQLFAMLNVERIPESRRQQADCMHFSILSHQQHSPSQPPLQMIVRSAPHVMYRGLHHACNFFSSSWPLCNKYVFLDEDCRTSSFFISFLFLRQIKRFNVLFHVCDTLQFLRVKAAMLSAHLSHRNSVRPSVCLSRGWIRQKRSKL